MLFTHCFPPAALFIHSPRGNGRDTTQPVGQGAGGGHQGGFYRGLWAARGASPCSQPAHSFWGGHGPLEEPIPCGDQPVGFVWVSLRCAALNESPRLQTQHPPDIPRSASWLPFPPASRRQGSPGWPRRLGTAAPLAPEQRPQEEPGSSRGPAASAAGGASSPAISVDVNDINFKPFY